MTRARETKLPILSILFILALLYVSSSHSENEVASDDYIYEAVSYENENETLIKATERPDPGKPNDVRVRMSNFGELEVKWSPPDNIKESPIFGYYVEYWKPNSVVLSEIQINQPPELVVHLKGLETYQEYQISVQSFIILNNFVEVRSLKTLAKLIRTAAGAPPVPILSDQGCVEGSRSINITWTPPQPPLNGPLDGYIVFVGHEIHVLGNETHFEKGGLHPHTMYTFHVSAYNYYDFGHISGRVEGKSNIVNCMTEVDAPGEVKNLTFRTTTDLFPNLNLYWSKPDVPNGYIDGYTVQCFKNETLIHNDEVANPSYYLQETEPFVFYEFKVNAYNNYYNRTTKETKILNGPQSTLSIVTNPGKPSAPINLQASAIHDQISVTWDEPVNPNGPINGYKGHYSLRYFRKHDNVGVKDILTNDTFILLTDVLPWREYTLELKAFNYYENNEKKGRINGGIKDARSINSLIIPPVPTLQLRTLNVSRTEADFFIPTKIFQNNHVFNYAVLVGQGETLDILEKNGYEDDRLNYNYWNTTNIERYLATPMDWKLTSGNDPMFNCRDDIKESEAGLRCTLGHNEDCDGFSYCNGKLKKNTQYRLKLRGYTAGGWFETKALQFRTNDATKTASFTFLISALILIVKMM